MLRLRDPGNWRRTSPLLLIFAVLVLTCNAKITWEFFRSADQALAIRSLKIATAETGERSKQKPSKRTLRFSERAATEARDVQPGAGLSSTPTVLEAAQSCLLVPSAKLISGSFTHWKPVVRPVLLGFYDLWRRPPPLASQSI